MAYFGQVPQGLGFPGTPGINPAAQPRQGLGGNIGNMLSNNRDWLSQFGMQLLANSGPSRYPVSFGQAIGQAGLGASQAVQQQRLMKRQEQLEDRRLEREEKEQERLEKQLAMEDRRQELISSKQEALDVALAENDLNKARMLAGQLERAQGKGLGSVTQSQLGLGGPTGTSTMQDIATLDQIRKGLMPGVSEEDFWRTKRGQRPQYLDTGGEFVGFGPTGQRVGQIQKGLAPAQQPGYREEVKAREVLGRARAEEQVSEPAKREAAANILEMTQDLLSNKEAVKKSYGKWQGATWIPEDFRTQDVIDTRAKINRLTNMLTVEARAKLANQGQITEGENKMLADSINLLTNTRISDEEAIREIERIENIMAGKYRTQDEEGVIWD